MKLLKLKQSTVKANAIELLSKVNEHRYQLAIAIASAIITAGVAYSTIDVSGQYGMAKRS